MIKKIANILVFAVITSTCYGFDDEVTHRDITQKSIDISVMSGLNDSLKNIGLANGTETIINSSPVWKWLKEGSKLEDSPTCRASNHFHNPLKPWDQSYMTDDPWYINTWCGLTGYSTRYSNITWGTGYLSRGGSKISISGQKWNWDDARAYYYQALTSTSGTDRETYFAKSFQALGQVLHLLEDMAVPAHTRNDFRSHLNYQGISLSWPTSWFGNNFEHYVKNNPGIVSGTSAIPSFTLLTDFWDTDGSAAGLAEFTNTNYFSDETIPNNNPTAEHTFPHPAVNNTSHQICEDYAPGSTDIRKYISRGVGSPCPQPGQAAVDHFATPSLLNEDFEITNDNISTLRLWLDDNVHDTYAKELLPKAVGYTAGLLNYFFRGKVNMEKDPQNAGKYIIKNESGEGMEGTFALYYDDASGNRNAVPGASWTLSINPNSTSSPVTFTEPTSPAPKEKGKYILVFQGKLGMEEGAVVGRAVKLAVDIGPYIKITEVKSQNHFNYSYSGDLIQYYTTWHVTFSLKGNDKSTDVQVPNNYNETLFTYSQPVERNLDYYSCYYCYRNTIMRWNLSNGERVESDNNGVWDYFHYAIPMATKWYGAGFPMLDSYDLRRLGYRETNFSIKLKDTSWNRVYLKPTSTEGPGNCWLGSTVEKGEIYAWLFTHKKYQPLGSAGPFVGQWGGKWGWNRWDRKLITAFGFTEEEILKIPMHDYKTYETMKWVGGTFRSQGGGSISILSVKPNVLIGTYAWDKCSNKFEYELIDTIPYPEVGTDEVLYDIFYTGSDADVSWTLTLVAE